MKGLRFTTVRRYASLRRNWIGKEGDAVETSPEKLRALAVELRTKARQLGLGLVGVTSPNKSARFDLYKQWLANNYHGELDYMEREDRVARRENPRLILPGVQSVVMVGMMYWPGMSGFPDSHKIPPPPSSSLAGDQTPRGVVSCYAWGVDYHVELSRRLKALGRYLNGKAGGLGRFYVDTGAILERDFAERAGFGFIGKNSLVINPRVGSGFFIGELFTTVPLPYSNSEGEEQGKEDGERGKENEEEQKQKAESRAKGKGRGKGRGNVKAGCGKCQKCKIACPTKAIVKDHVVDARRCISYLTIELKGSIPTELRRAMGNRIYGCDICQMVCPWNKFQWDHVQGQGNTVAYSPLFGHVDETVCNPSLRDLLQMDDDAFQQRFKGTAVKRIGRERMQRNAAVALGNVGGRNELECLQRVVAASDTSALVREHAHWAIAEIQGRLAKKTTEDSPGTVQAI